MEEANEFREQYNKGKKLIIAIIVGRIILEVFSIAMAINRESGEVASVAGAIIWIVLLVKLYSGSKWAPCVIAIFNIISIVIGIGLIVTIIPVLTIGYGNVKTMLVLLLIISYLVPSTIILLKNEKVRVFLEYQA